MENYLDLNIVILPPAEISQQLVKMSEEISSRYETQFTLNLSNTLPHLSLYSARYPEKNLEEITSALTKISQQISSFPLTLSGYTNFHGFIFYDVEKTKQLLSLHEIIVDTLNPLREGLVSDNMKALSQLSDAHKLAIETYGYVSVKDLYMPHISLTSLKDITQAETAIADLPEKIRTFPITSLALTPFANFGTCPQVITMFPLP